MFSIEIYTCNDNDVQEVTADSNKSQKSGICFVFPLLWKGKKIKNSSVGQRQTFCCKLQETVNFKDMK